MPGKNYIKVTSILLAVSAVIALIVYTVGDLLLSYATVASGEKYGWLVVAMCLFYTLLSVIQLVASVKGIKGCNDRDAVTDLKKWGHILLTAAVVCGIVSFIQNVLHGKAVSVSAGLSLLTLLLPVLYVYGVRLNEKA